MAKVTITIEDSPNGRVKMVVTPNFEQMVEMLQSGHDMTPAHGYAIRCINAVREASKEQADKMLIKLPGLK